MTARKVDNVWDGMPRVAFDAIKAYMGDELINPLRLTDWTVELAKEPADDDCLASVNVTYGRRWAVINVCKDFTTETPEVQRHTLIHELVHCHTDPIRANLQHVIGRLYGTVAWESIYGPLHRDIELCTDDLANALAPFFPLPSIPKSED